MLPRIPAARLIYLMLAAEGSIKGEKKKQETSPLDYLPAEPVTKKSVQARNALCNCGSGKKFKNCCRGK